MSCRAGVAALAALLSLSACGVGADAPPLVTTTSSPDGDITGVAWLWEPVVEQIDCPAPLARPDLACGRVELLLDVDDPTGGTTHISVATLAGTSDPGTAMAVLQGGPGGASTDLAAWLPRQPFTQVFVDQRGTGFAGPDLDCAEYEEVQPSLLEVPADRIDAESAAALAACAERLGNEPILLHTDSPTHADDVVTVMYALGHLRDWFVYGVSYGSTIGLEVLRADPGGLAGVVLDGVYPPTLDLDRALDVSARSSVEAITSACALDAECAGRTPHFGDALDRLVTRLDARPLTVVLDADESGFGREVEVRLDGRRLAEFVFVLLYNERNIAGLPGAVAGIASGDDAAARWLAGAGARTLAAAYAANDEATYFAVQCAERLAVASGPRPDSGGFLGALRGPPLVDSCRPWPSAGRADLPPRSPVASSVPVLLLSGGFDPITPAVYADDVARDLGQSTMVVQDGRGHGIWIGDECIQSIVARFVAGERLDTTCAVDPVPVDWFTPQ